MTIRLFDIENGTVKPSEHCYTIKWLKAIMDEFPDPVQHSKVYAYLFYMTCPNPELNPYFNLSEFEKEELILSDLAFDFSTDAPCIKVAKDNAEKLYETPTLRAYRGISKMLDNLSDYMGNTTIEHGRDGNISALVQAAKNFQAIRESFKGVQKDLEDEQKKGRARGGTDLAYDQE
jgi:hypothetical protein